MGCLYPATTNVWGRIADEVTEASGRSRRPVDMTVSFSICPLQIFDRTSVHNFLNSNHRAAYQQARHDRVTRLQVSSTTRTNNQPTGRGSAVETAGIKSNINHFFFRRAFHFFIVVLSLDGLVTTTNNRRSFHRPTKEKGCRPTNLAVLRRVPLHRHLPSSDTTSGQLLPTISSTSTRVPRRALMIRKSNRSPPP
jgi:hypothetical protein